MLKVMVILWLTLKVVVVCTGWAVFVLIALANCALSIYCCPGNAPTVGEGRAVGDGTVVAGGKVPLVIVDVPMEALVVLIEGSPDAMK